MSIPEDIRAYDRSLDAHDRELCEHLGRAISDALPEAEAKVWHRHPVWFIDGNPVVGYHRLSSGVRVLFWSGQSFPTPGLIDTGSFKAAEVYPGSVDGLASLPMEAWLRDSRDIQWDYKDMMKKKRLDKRTDF